MSSLCNKYKSTTLFNFPNNFPLFSSNVNVNLIGKVLYLVANDLSRAIMKLKVCNCKVAFNTFA